MALRWYILPLVTSDVPRPNSRVPKYIAGQDVDFNLMDFGLLSTCMIWVDVTPQQHNQLSNLDDVIVIPSNIDALVTPATRLAVIAALESLRIPGNWVQVGTPYRSIMRITCGLFQFAQRLHGQYGRKLIPDQLDLNSTWSDIPRNWQIDLIETAESFQYPYQDWGITGDSTVRYILKKLADAWGDQTFLFGMYEGEQVIL